MSSTVIVGTLSACRWTGGHRDDRRTPVRETCGWRASRDWRSRGAGRTGSGADALDIRRVEARLRSATSRSRSKASSRLLLQHPQRAAEIIAGGVEAQLDGAALEPLAKRLGVEIGRRLRPSGWRPCWRRRTCPRGPAPRRRRRRIPSRSAARWRPARTTPRCRPAITRRWILAAACDGAAASVVQSEAGGDDQRGAAGGAEAEYSRPLLLALRRRWYP